MGRFFVVKKERGVRWSPQHKSSLGDMGIPLRARLRWVRWVRTPGDVWVGKRLPRHPESFAVHVFMENRKAEEVRFAGRLGEAWQVFDDSVHDSVEVCERGIARRQRQVPPSVVRDVA